MLSTIWWSVLGLVLISIHAVQNQIMQSSLNLLAPGFDFLPANPVELITTYTGMNSFLLCYIQCNMNPLCRTFVSDIVLPSVCRLYEGSIDTGTIVKASSLTSRVGGLYYYPSLYDVYNQMCDPHVLSSNRYLICFDNVWQCPTTTFWNGSMCVNQVYYGDSCTMNAACRQDIGLQCSSDCQKCICNSTASWNNTSCVIGQTVCPSSKPSDPCVAAYWPLDGNANDLTNTHNGTFVGNLSFTMGYIDRAIQCSGTAYINVSYIDFYRRSFTIEFWFYINNRTSANIGLLGECMHGSTDTCLHLGLSDGSTPYMGFYNDDSAGSSSIVNYQWYHIAFVYNNTARQRQIYVNGLLENITLPNSLSPTGYLGQSGQIIICKSIHWPLNSITYMDQIFVTQRAKTVNEILNDATLISYYSFDCDSILDSGPNLLQSIAVGQTMITGRVKDALLFNSTSAYFRTSSFMTFGIVNQSFSIGLWVKPANLHGILVHISNQSTGDGWCMPLLGFNSSGILIAQSSSLIIAVPTFPLNVWTHIAQTFSIQNGLQLYINGTLYQIVVGASMTPSYQSMYVSIGSQQMGGSSCMWGGIEPRSYSGAVDELRIYNRQITTAEITSISS
ncbi:unnamed protein product [Adineta steineri]|uniref:LamG-like jellyroll fold domain-containing protein n=1 Tax=Adineta steineri TaxID=433720 RepID=A0A819V478_9BILA|nr:unnamed protein product [Adineta steineri]CAF4103798.1 unnamed protein product [Adineta steineri]